MLIRALEENSALCCRVLHMEYPLFCHFLWNFFCVCISQIHSEEVLREAWTAAGRSQENGRRVNLGIWLCSFWERVRLVCRWMTQARECYE